jgi:hypothetical protein
MPRRIQRKPIRQIREKVAGEQAVTQGINIQGLITVLGGITGIIVAILWTAGRFYAAGYFGAMNIPAFQINFSVWEYAEVAWLKLIFYFLNRIYPIVLLLAIVPLATLILAFLLQRIFRRLKLIDAANKIVSRFGRLRSAISYIAVFTIIVIFSYVLLQAFVDINRSGQFEGKEVVLSSSYAVQVYSKDYLPLGPPKVITNTTSTLMEYNGLRLLTFNNGKYYLFRDIDPVTCKPSQVFVVTDSPNIVLVFSAIAPIDTPCAITETTQ